MSSEESSDGYDSSPLVRKNQRNIDQIIVTPPSSDSKSDGSFEEESTPISALNTKRRKKVETQSDFKTAQAKEESVADARKKELVRERKAKRKKQIEALEAVPVFGLGPGRCPHIVLELHDDKPSISTFESVVECGRGRNWPRMRFLIPEPNDRPWAPPPGHLCVYECFFDQGGLGFPIPPVIMEYCARRRISISQLTHASFRNLMSILTLTYEAGRVVTCDHFEEACDFTRGNTFDSGRFQVKMKSGLALTKNFSNRLVGNWQEYYFFVEINEDSIGSYDGEIRIGWNKRVDIQTKPLPDSTSKCVVGLLQRYPAQDWPSFLDVRIRRVYPRIVSGNPCLALDVSTRVASKSDKRKMPKSNPTRLPPPKPKAGVKASAPTAPSVQKTAGTGTSGLAKLDLIQPPFPPKPKTGAGKSKTMASAKDKSAGESALSDHAEGVPRGIEKEVVSRHTTGTASKKRSRDESAPVVVKHGAGKDFGAVFSRKRARQDSEESSQALMASPAENVDANVDTDRERRDTDPMDEGRDAEKGVDAEESLLVLPSRNELTFSDDFSYSYQGFGDHILEHPEECAKYINCIRGVSRGPNSELDEMFDREGFCQSAANIVDTIVSFNSVWGRFNSAMKREQRLKQELNFVKAQNEMLEKEKKSMEPGGASEEVEELKKELGTVKQELRTVKQELEKKTKYSEGKSKMLADVRKDFEALSEKHNRTEAKFEDVRGRLVRAEEANAALIEHVRAHIPRLRSSRREHGLSCAKQAAEWVRSDLIGQAQSLLDRARMHCSERVELSRLNSLASQVKTQLDMISEYEIEVDVEEVEANFEEYRKQIEAMQLTAFSEGDYEFVPDPIILPEDYEEDRAESPFGENLGIEPDWVLEPYVGEWTEKADAGEEDTRGNGQTVGSEQDAEVILAAVNSNSPRSVEIINQFVSGIISKVAEDLMDEIADRVLAEPIVADQTMAGASAKDPGVEASGAVDPAEVGVPAKDPKTGEDLAPLFAPLPLTSFPSDQHTA